MKITLQTLSPLGYRLLAKLNELQKAKQLMSNTLKLQLTDTMASELDYLPLRAIQQIRASKSI